MKLPEQTFDLSSSNSPFSFGVDANDAMWSAHMHLSAPPPYMPSPPAHAATYPQPVHLPAVQGMHTLQEPAPGSFASCQAGQAPTVSCQPDPFSDQNLLDMEVPAPDAARAHLRRTPGYRPSPVRPRLAENAGAIRGMRSVIVKSRPAHHANERISKLCLRPHAQDKCSSEIEFCEGHHQLHVGLRVCWLVADWHPS